MSIECPDNEIDNGFSKEYLSAPASDRKRSSTNPILERRRSSMLGVYKVESDDHESTDDILYKVDDVPPWYMCLFLGFQVSLSISTSFIRVLDWKQHTLEAHMRFSEVYLTFEPSLIRK